MFYKVITKLKISLTGFFLNNFFNVLKSDNIKQILRWRVYYFNIVSAIMFVLYICFAIVFLSIKFTNNNTDIPISIIVVNFIIIFCFAIVRKIPYTIRSIMLCFSLYFAGLINFIKIGPVSSSLFLILISSIFYAAFIGTRGVIISCILNTVTVLFFGYLISHYNMGWVGISDNFYFNYSWFLTAAAFIVINIGSALFVSLLISNFEKSLAVNIESKNAIIIGLASLTEYRDIDTGKHLERISKYSVILAKDLMKSPKYKNYITKKYIDDISISSILHDIGKVGIEDKILLKPGKLTPIEFDKIKLHPEIGRQVLKNITKKIRSKDLLSMAYQIVLCHHEKYDGTGYPNQLKGNRIPLSARIVALVDVYDALTSNRIYKKAFPHKKAVDIIVSSKGTHFDPFLVDIFVKNQTKFRDIQLALQ